MDQALELLAEVEELSGELLALEGSALPTPTRGSNEGTERREVQRLQARVVTLDGKCATLEVPVHEHVCVCKNAFPSAEHVLCNTFVYMCPWMESQ